MSEINQISLLYLLRGRVKLSQSLMDPRAFPFPSPEEIDEFLAFQAGVKLLFEKGILFAYDENTIAAFKPEYLQQLKFKQFLADQGVSLDQMTVKEEAPAEKSFSDTVIEGADL